MVKNTSWGLSRRENSPAAIMQKHERRKVVIIGSGVAGITAAARLARSGVHVSLYEKNDFFGGNCSLIKQNGYRFDCGPSIMLMIEIFEELFEQLGTSMTAENIELIKCDPNCHIWFSDGEVFTTSTDLTHMKQQIEKIEGRAGFNSYIDFLQESQEHYEQSITHVLKKDFPDFLSLLRPRFLRYLFKLHPFHSVWQRTSHFFRFHKVRQVFTLGSMYLGMSPFEIPGTYTLLQYTELTGGVWYPRGGFYRVLDSLINIGKRHGAKYYCSTPVEHIVISKRKKVLGVVLESGKFVEADAVLVNADLLYAYEQLLPKDPSTAGILGRRTDVSCSTISFYWSLSKKVPELGVHNMFVDNSFGKRDKNVYWDPDGSVKPNFYIHIPSRVDETAAPEGKDAMNVLILVRNFEDSSSTKEFALKIISKAREQVISSIEQRTGISNFKELIENETFHIPSSWERTFNATEGGVFGLKHNFFNILAFRPKMRHHNFSGVYFAGASTHPGAGVPTCIAGANLSTEEILRDLGVNPFWSTSSSNKRYHFKFPLLRNIMIALYDWKYLILIITSFLLLMSVMIL